MLKRIVILSAVLVMMMTVFVGMASANVKLEGNGWLKARGSGIARLQGDFDGLSISGTGVLWYFDEGEEDVPLLEGRGRVHHHRNGWTEVRGFHGTLTVTDADMFEVGISGAHIDLFAEGAGKAFLKGSGTYSSSGDAGRWIGGTDVEIVAID